MRIGASSQLIASRSAATRSRTCAGSRQLRRKRMKPSGSAARKKRCSSGLSSSPVQPRMTARGAFLGAPPTSPGNDAPDAALLQLAADPLGRRLVRDGSRQDAVVDPLLAQIGADWRRRQRAEKVGVLPPDPLPVLARGILAAHRAEL